ncbi:MAG: Uma2 family endonuclease [Actinomycetota bacterium]|nr:Uma2 family endonuclease [Actinomycetota bacterium]
MNDTKLLTYEDFLTFPDDGVRREILEGELFVSPSPVLRHQDVAGLIYVSLHNHIKANGGGRTFIAPLDVLLGKHDIVEPDVIFVADDRLGILHEKHLIGAPTLLVEVVSDSRTDRVRKRNVYARAGVPTYWVADPDSDRVEVYRLHGISYAKPDILEPGETLTLDELPGLRIELAELFQR